MAGKWDEERSTKRIEGRIAEVKDVEIREYRRDKNLSAIPTNYAYRVRGSHIYVDILNMTEILNSTNSEGEISHKRTLRFLDLQQRAIRRVLDKEDAIFVDFHGARLHAVVVKPYDNEEDKSQARTDKAVAIADLIMNVLKETADEEDHLPAATVRVGIDTGVTLAVNNGRRGGREPLFLGRPANKAAKHAAGEKEGIYLTRDARRAVELPKNVDTRDTKLSVAEISGCKQRTSLDSQKDEVLKSWRAEKSTHRLSDYSFSGVTPPVRDLDFENLTPRNAKRQECVAIFADLDGFTKYVASRVDNADAEEEAVQVLHVIRAELASALESDFGGRRVRYIGDCVHGIILEGTANNTDVESSISEATLCSGALRSSFDKCIEVLKKNGISVSGLGLQIGFDVGPLSILRLGLKGKRKRCALGRATLRAESEQKRCAKDETCIGREASKKGRQSVRDLFGDDRRSKNLTYAKAVHKLEDADDKNATKHASIGAPSIAAEARREPLRAHAAQKPSGSP